MKIDIKLIDYENLNAVIKEIQHYYSMGYVLQGGIIPVNTGTPGSYWPRYHATMVKEIDDRLHCED